MNRGVLFAGKFSSKCVIMSNEKIIISNKKIIMINEKIIMSNEKSVKILVESDRSKIILKFGVNP